EAAMDRHLVAKRGDLFRKAAGDVLPQPIDPGDERRARRLVEAEALLVGQGARELQRREPRGVQDFVRVRVADTAEEMRVGQRALERVALARQRLVKLLRRRLERLDAARVERAKRVLAANQLHRGAFL